MAQCATAVPTKMCEELDLNRKKMISIYSSATDLKCRLFGYKSEQIAKSNDCSCEPDGIYENILKDSELLDAINDVLSFISERL